MRKILSIIFLLLFSIILFDSCKNISEKKIEKEIMLINIKSVDFFSIMTTISVQCDSFEEYFQNYKLIQMTDTLRIGKLLTIIDNLKSIDSIHIKDIDTRAKIELITSKDTNIICVGDLFLKKNNSFFKTSEELINYIENL